MLCSYQKLTVVPWPEIRYVRLYIYVALTKGCHQDPKELVYSEVYLASTDSMTEQYVFLQRELRQISYLAETGEAKY